MIINAILYYYNTYVLTFFKSLLSDHLLVLLIMYLRIHRIRRIKKTIKPIT